MGVRVSLEHILNNVSPLHHNKTNESNECFHSAHDAHLPAERHPRSQSCRKRLKSLNGRDMQKS